MTWPVGWTPLDKNFWKRLEGASALLMFPLVSWHFMTSHHRSQWIWLEQLSLSAAMAISIYWTFWLCAIVDAKWQLIYIDFLWFSKLLHKKGIQQPHHCSHKSRKASKISAPHESPTTRRCRQRLANWASWPKPWNAVEPLESNTCWNSNERNLSSPSIFILHVTLNRVGMAGRPQLPSLTILLNHAQQCQLPRPWETWNFDVVDSLQQH